MAEMCIRDSLGRDAGQGVRLFWRAGGGAAGRSRPVGAGGAEAARRGCPVPVSYTHLAALEERDEAAEEKAAPKAEA